MKPLPEEQTPCHSSFSAGIICGPHRGSFSVRDHLRSNLGIISGLGIICGAVHIDATGYWLHLGDFYSFYSCLEVFLIHDERSKHLVKPWMKVTEAMLIINNHSTACLFHLISVRGVHLPSFATTFGFPCSFSSCFKNSSSATGS